MTFNYADLQRHAIQGQLTGERDRRRSVGRADQRSAEQGFGAGSETRDPVAPSAQPDLMGLRITRTRERRQAVMLVEAEYRAKATELHADPHQLKIAHDDAIRAVYAAHPLER